MPQTAATSNRVRALVLATVIAIAAAGLVYLADQAAAARDSKVLGTTKRTPKPLCPDNCSATGSVTGFGIAANGKRGLYKVPEDGHIVAWAVELSKPTKEQLAGFGEIFADPKFGKAPQARISILKKKGKRSRYTLAKATPIMPLQGSLGEKPIFTLQKPLRVKKGRVAALTLPTWAPLYKDGLNSTDNIWKASRKSDECGVEDVPDAKPQLRKGSTRTYGCKLAGERILYWAYFVPEKKSGKK